MTRIIQDSLDKDRHQTFKRFERRAQWSAWKRRGDEKESPPLPCLVPGKTDGLPEIRLAHLILLFGEDLALVRYSEDGRDSPGLRVVRSGILWDQWHPWILHAYLRGAAVPKPFIPLRRIPPGWIEEALTRSPYLQSLFFDKMRGTRLLPALSKMDAPTLSPWMRWEDVRANFFDFKDSLPIRSNIPAHPLESIL